jgi:ketopantoate reductase
MGGVRHSDVHVEFELDDATWLGPWAGDPVALREVEAVRDLLREAGLRAEAFADLRPAQWAKLVFTAAVGSVSALTELPHVPQLAARESPVDAGHVVHDLIEEGKAVAAAAGIDLHEDPWQMNVDAVTRGRSTSGDGGYAHRPSFLVDVLAYDPAREHVAAIERDGLAITGADEFVARLRASADPAGLPHCDFAIVASKSVHTRAAIEATAHALAGGAVCSVQNGVGNEEAIAELVPCVIRGTTFPAGRVLGPGRLPGTRRATRGSGRSSRLRRRWTPSASWRRLSRGPASPPTRSPTRAARSGRS